MNLFLKINLIFLIFNMLPFPAYSQMDWQIPIHIRCEEWQTYLNFGMHPACSDLFDSSYDTLAPPPGFSPYFYFYIGSFPNYLLTDIRGGQDRINWRLRSNNCGGKSVKLIWDSDEYAGLFEDNVIIMINGSINMLETDSLVLNGDIALEIVHTKTTSVQMLSDFNDTDSQCIFTFPNPSNHGISLNIGMQKDGLAEINILDIKGCLVRNIFHGVLLSGLHKAYWDGTDFTGMPVHSGNYLVYAVLSDQAYTRRILIIK